MSRRKTARIIKQDKYSRQWNLYYRLNNFTERLDRTKDAAEIKKEKQKSVPVSMVEMIF